MRGDCAADRVCVGGNARSPASSTRPLTKSTFRRLNEHVEAWVGVEFRHLAALLAIAQERSFGRAARRLGYSQSAISGQIASLEKIVGERLVERSRGRAKVALTPAGNVLARHAEQMTQQMEVARAEMKGVRDAGRLA
jgi:molybdate transport repressor ModE-like protein